MKKKPSYEVSLQFIKSMLKDKRKQPSIDQLQFIIDSIFPFSWAKFCDENNFQYEISIKLQGRKKSSQGR